MVEKEQNGFGLREKQFFHSNALLGTGTTCSCINVALVMSGVQSHISHHDGISQRAKTAKHDLESLATTLSVLKINFCV